MGKPLIIGYDPGTTAGLAILDSGKNIIYLKSKKEFKKKDIVESIVKRGNPIIVAGDKNPLPKNVGKLASSLGCKIYEPEEDLSNIEKYNSVKEYMDLINNDHEKDALASALKAYNNYSRLFEKVDKTVSYLGLNEFYDKILKLLIDEEANNLNEAVEMVMEKVRKKPKKVEVKKRESKKVKELRGKVKRLENDIDILKSYNESLKKRLEDTDEKFMKKKLEKTRDKGRKRDRRKINTLKKELERKEIVIEKLKSFRIIDREGYVPVIELEKIDLDKLKKLDGMFGLKDMVVSTNNFSNLQYLNDYNIRALILPEKLDDEAIERLKYPVITDEMEKRNVDEITVIEKVEFEEKLKKARKSGFIQWINGHRKRRL